MVVAGKQSCICCSAMSARHLLLACWSESRPEVSASAFFLMFDWLPLGPFGCLDRVFIFYGLHSLNHCITGKAFKSSGWSQTTNETKPNSCFCYLRSRLFLLRRSLIFVILFACLLSRSTLFFVSIPFAGNRRSTSMLRSVDPDNNHARGNNARACSVQP